jgi:hypothetical protein
MPSRRPTGRSKRIQFLPWNTFARPLKSCTSHGRPSITVYIAAYNSTRPPDYSIKKELKMNKVYLHKPMGKDELLGRVGGDGKVYDERFGPDEYIGWVNLEDGKIYISRVGRTNISAG